MSKPNLFSPIRLRDVEVRNRVWVSPMCQYSATEGVPNDWHVVHLGAFGRGGAGLVLAEATGVVPEGRISPGCLGLWNDEQEAAFAHVAKVVHSHGAKFGIQLAHAGRKASLYRMLPGQPDGSIPLSTPEAPTEGWETVGPSAIAFPGLREPRALETAEVKDIVQAFIAAAARAARAGCDVVELHGAHGYILHSFLSPLSNERTDEYGGSPENRARLLREVVRGIRAEQPELPILVRISATEWTDGGFGIEDSKQLVGWLIEDGADFIDVSSGANIPAKIPVGPSYQTMLAAKVREAGLPVGAVGMITSAAQAETILVTGQADVVFVGRAMLANPHLALAWAYELRADNADDFRPGPYMRARF
ncbi:MULTISPECIES: NADH:flavin oxidoreductase/NADH oxidase [unclassified Leucobacter]|uniref:NADH:flavin oxidoreductase/NADH oxidase n=1 Tax=unclassified Leucobacter TaxID=2621730 RepID=UPI00165DF27C|nr:NADH:flavin oxidoreductase/NADH oxidase [Leucobacter sp. CX169]MBC9926475.1 NADH:flavin oxidoreductase/NADH oxidase [Leucobacter sp. cx-169]MBC9937049.1 NADH:flavin oxidoreductase/NADH oxidase [Leucobacter sp. cx-87]